MLKTKGRPKSVRGIKRYISSDGNNVPFEEAYDIYKSTVVFEEIFTPTVPTSAVSQEMLPSTLPQPLMVASTSANKDHEMTVCSMPEDVSSSDDTHLPAPLPVVSSSSSSLIRTTRKRTYVHEVCSNTYNNQF